MKTDAKHGKTPCRLVWLVYNAVWHSGVGPDAVVANVAQLVEQRFRKARVAGSSPVVGSILSSFFFATDGHHVERGKQIKHRFSPIFPACGDSCREPVLGTLEGI
jgi:hypothetical protein